MDKMKSWRAMARLVGLALVWACAPAAQAACDPTMACCKGVDLGGNPGCAGAGNPIDVITGNKYQREVDLAPLPGVLGLEIVRHYNSVYAHDSGHSASRFGAVGRGWKLGYEIELVAAGGNRLQVVRADGKPVNFTRGILDARHYLAADPADGELVPREVAGGKGHVWRWLDGHEYSFDAKGRLVQIAAPTGEFVSLRHDPANGQLLKVTDPQGRSLDLQYAKSGYVRAIDTPVGKFGYEYGPLGQLLKATYPGLGPQHTVRLYHHEDPRFPTLLTGITVQGTGSDGQPMQQRIGTYAYDSEGRGNLTVKGEPARLRTGADGKPIQPAHLVEGTGLEQVVLFHGRGKTVAVNGLGQKTEFTWGEVNGENKLLEVRGAGCSHCAGPNERYGYDKLGRLNQTTRITEQGQPIDTTKLELDLYGRTRSISRIAYRNGKPQAPELLVSYGYDSRNPQPTRISRPSVIAGKEHITRITYDEAGQPTSVTEEGFSPIDEQGNPSPNGTLIRRITTYAYSRINGRSVLTQIDGPLPNGPKQDPSDSDITRIEYDARADHVVAVVQPMGFRSSIRFDAQGRIAEVTGPSGATDRYRYDAQGAVLAVATVTHGQALQAVVYRYDVAGNVIEVVDQAGGRPAPRVRQEFDTAGRLLWQASSLGLFRHAAYDPEGHILRSTVLGAGIRQEERYRYDGRGRLQQVQDSTGVTRELVHDDGGRLIASIDALGRWTRYQPEPHALEVIQAVNTGKPLTVRYQLDDRGQLQSVSAQGHDGMNISRPVKHRRDVDDFGREVAVHSPDSGREVRRFDKAGRITQILQAAGSTVDLAYDLAGHLVRLTATPNAVKGAQAGGIPSQAAQPQTVRYRYALGRVIEADDPQQNERYTYDERGRVQTRTVTLRLNDGTQATSTTRYRYDERGLLAAQTLPDGSELQYVRNGQGQIVALHRQTAPWAPFGWGRTVLARDLERDLNGLRHITYGNGIEGQWQRSRQGVLARVVYTAPAADRSAVRTAFESLIPEAKAQGPIPATAASAPGAFGLPREPKALWDSRLLFDAAGNIVVQGQFADSEAARPHHTALAYDAQDQLAQAVRTVEGGVSTSGARQGEVWRYHHDSLGNRLLGQQAQSAGERGHTVHAVYAAESDRSEAQEMDPAGRPQRDGARRYAWDGLGRLTSVTQDGRTTGYRYNRLGLRVAKQGSVQQHYLYDEQRRRVAELDAHGRLTRQYVWLGDQLVAVLDGTPRALQAPAQSWVGQAARAMRALWQTVTDDAATPVYVQVNHLGAPVMVTDANAHPVWHAEYAPFGQRIEGHTGIVKTGGHVPQSGAQGMRLDLRLPGQWEDEESGLYYNDQRYYDPEQGRYLSPDPLGIQGGLNAYAYVGNNPLGFGDPLGLILFAFDGTGNTNDTAWLNSHGSSPSNVWQFDQLYNDGDARYVTGVGTLHPDTQYGDIRPEDYSRGTLLGLMPGVSLEDADMGGNYSGPARIERMVQYFNDEADLFTDDRAAMDVDIVGFSRGAAEARDFANIITRQTVNGYYSYTSSKDGKQHCQKLNFRFLGLWDTVLSTNRTDHAYNLSIPDQFAYVAHAVALNEYRRDASHAGMSSFGAFPLESIMQGEYSPVPQLGKTRIERGFLGAHADIGGGFGASESQLSQVALVWMVDQAKAAGVKMGDSPLLHTVVANPIVHDKSDNISWGKPGPYTEDREVRYGGGTTTTQRKMAFSSGMSYADTLQFIHYFDRDLLSRDWQQHQDLFQTGTVDMKGYLQWLNENGYDVDLTIQGL